VLTKDEWRSFIEATNSDRPIVVQAITLLRTWNTASKPVLLACNDGNQYVVKGRQAGRMIVNDQVVARLGRSIGAPVGSVLLVDVSTDLIAANP
jgi:hypothetical protein